MLCLHVRQDVQIDGGSLADVCVSFYGTLECVLVEIGFEANGIEFALGFKVYIGLGQLDVVDFVGSRGIGNDSDKEVACFFQVAVQFAQDDFVSDLVSGLLYGGDPYMLIADYRAYVECRDRLYARLADDMERARLALVNTAESGFFAADRAIREYAERIWNL